jgi:hypothetical protein
MIKLFFFLRIFSKLTYIVTMLVQVSKDLQIFLTFFMVVIFMGALCFDLVIDASSIDEYRKIGPFLGSFVYTLRLSLGDFDFDLIDDDIMSKNE